MAEVIAVSPEGLYSKRAIQLIAEYYNMSEEEVIEYLQQPRWYKLIALSKTVQPGQWIEPRDNYRTIHFHGSIEKVFIVFPQGTNGRVKVRILVGNTPILPDQGYLALNGFQGWFDVNFPVRDGEFVAAEIINEGENPHDITILVLLSNRLLYVPL